MQPIDIPAGPGTQVATAAIVFALMEHLTASGVLKPGDDRTILANAIEGLKPRSNMIAVVDAIAFLNRMLQR